MGVGRREFLKLTSLALAGLAIDPLRAVVITDDVYLNKKLGILFHKPRSWSFIDVADFGRLESEQLFENGWEKLKDQDWVDEGLPICVAAKYQQDSPDNKGVFSPAIALYVTPKASLAHLGPCTLEEHMAMTMHGTSQFLKEFQLETVSEPYFLNGSKFCEFDATYLFEHIEFPNPFRTELKMLMAEHNNTYYTFTLHQSVSQNQVARREFEEFKRTIKLI